MNYPESFSQRGSSFIQEEFKWRNVASAVWAWVVTFVIMTIFLIAFSLNLSQHIYMMYDYVTVLLSLHTLSILAVTAVSTSCLVFVHSWYHSDAQTYPCNRLEFVRKTLTSSNLLYVMVNVAFFVLISYLIPCILSGRYSLTEYECDSSHNADVPLGGQVGLLPIFMYFGVTVGIVNALDWIFSRRYTLNYWNVQEAKFLFLKCKLPCVLLNCASKSAQTLYYFLIAVYMVGYVIRDIMAFFFGTYSSGFYSLQFWRMFRVIPVAWNLWLVGTLSLTLWELSWQIFNAYQTQNYAFLIRQTFLENHQKLLFENLEETKPSIVQHLAFRHLSTIVKENPSKRREIFALSHETDNGQPVNWNKVLHNCLLHIKHLTDEMKKYQLALSDLTIEEKQDQNMFPFDEQNVDGSAISIHCNASKELRCRGIDNNSCIVGHHQSIIVPTPRLWTKRNQKSAVNEPVHTSTFHGSHMKEKFMRLPLVSYFLKMVPSWTLRNIYRHHLLVQYSFQTLSYICAMSISEDQFGVVQGHLREVIECLADLLKALDNVGKIGRSSSYVSKLHWSLYGGLKSSLHRIIDAFGDSLKSVNLSQEHRRLVDVFHRYDE